VIAANSGDYVYPRDVRVNPGTERLYVLTAGAAVGIWDAKELFEFDLKSRRLLTPCLFPSLL
jgi:hypothetical protein